MTRWQQQTIAGGPDAPPEKRGNCLSACIASVLGVSLGAIAIPHGEGWWDRVNQACGDYGYCVAVIDCDLEPPASYWIATVPSLNLIPPEGAPPILHCVVAQGYELVHDPSKAKRYDDASWATAWNEGAVVEGWVLVPLDPAVCLGRAA